MNLFKKFTSLGLAATMALTVTGCNLSAPTTVGNIGGVEIPAGVYLLAQYNAYNSASSVAELATGETASDVKAVLKATCSGTIGEEEVTATGAEYVEKLTMRSLEYYAAVENTFEQLGGVLDDAATAEAAATADSLWTSNGDLYTANGIGKESVLNYLLNAEKAQACMELIYGEGGSEEVSDADYTAYVEDECRYLDTLQFSLIDYNTYAMAGEEQAEQIRALAQQAADSLNEQATAETSASDVYFNLYMAASEYLPQAYQAMGASFDMNQLPYFFGSQLYHADDLSSFENEDGSNDLTDPLDAAGKGKWIVLDLGYNILVVRDSDPFAYQTLDELKTSADLLNAMKSEEVQERFYNEGAALEQALNQSAMNTYKASKIKKTV